MKELINLLAKLFNLIIGLTFLVTFLFVGLLLLNGNPEWVDSWSSAEEETSLSMVKSSEIVDGIHTPTGLLDGPGLDMVIRNCTGCHSAKLITQNKATTSGWRGTIQWMQETQGLWQLGDQEDIIVQYLAEFYAPVDEGRRRNLPTPEWYELD